MPAKCLDLDKVLNDVIIFSEFCEKYVPETSPWKLAIYISYLEKLGFKVKSFPEIV